MSELEQVNAELAGIVLNRIRADPGRVHETEHDHVLWVIRTGRGGAGVSEDAAIPEIQVVDEVEVEDPPVVLLAADERQRTAAWTKKAREACESRAAGTPGLAAPAME